MKISVITVSFNAAATIRFTLDSFAEQTYSNKDLLVVDGGSTDDTVTIVSSYAADGISVISEPDKGIYHAMNKGLERYSGDAVGFLNSNDRFADRDCLADIASALHVADIVYGHLDFVADHQSRRVVRRWRASRYQPRAFKKGWMPAHPTFYMRRRVANAVGKYDERFRIAADYDYMLRAFELNAFQTAFLDRVLVQMLYGGTSTRGVCAYLQSNLESYRSRRKWIGAGRFDVALFAKPLRKLPQFLARYRR
jgi:glycosyltransferase involved in cell wall biosynthesis